MIERNNYFFDGIALKELLKDDIDEDVIDSYINKNKKILNNISLLFNKLEQKEMKETQIEKFNKKVDPLSKSVSEPVNEIEIFNKIKKSFNKIRE